MSLMATGKNPKKTPRAGKPVNVWLPDALVDALDQYVDDTRPRTTKAGAVEAALEEYLKSKGYWPPAPPSQSDT